MIFFPQHMIWEIDEKGDGIIDYEEFLLTYYRNIHDMTGSEPCSFFHVLEVRNKYSYISSMFYIILFIL